MSELSFTPPPPKDDGALADTPHNRIIGLMNLYKSWSPGEQNKLLMQLKQENWTEDEIERAIAAHWASADESKDGFEKGRAKPTVGRLGTMRQRWIQERNEKDKNTYNRRHYNSKTLIANQSKKGAEHFANIRKILANTHTQHQGGERGNNVITFPTLPAVDLKPKRTSL